MSIKGHIFLIVLLCSGGLFLKAQTSDTSNMNYVILGDFKPTLSTANKVISWPDIQPVASTTPTFKYDLPNFGYSVLPTYHPAKAISIKSELDQPLFGNYFRLGAGNYLTTLGEFRVHSVRNKKFNYGVSGKHLAANAGNPANADFSDNELGLVGSKIGSKGELTGKLNYERHVVHFYGYDDTLEYDKRNINQIFNEFNGSVVYNRGYGIKRMGYKPGFDFYTFATHGGRRENDFRGSVKTLFQLPQKREIKLDAAVDYTNLIEDSKTVLNRTFIRVNPSYSFVIKKITIKAGINAVVPIDSNKATFKLYPDITAEHFIVPKKVKAFAMLGGDVKKNSLRQLSYLNPFVANDIEIQNTTNSFRIGGGLKGLLAKKIDYLLKVDFSLDNNMPLFLTDSVPTRQFGVVYDDVQTVAFQTGFGFRFEERLFIQFATTLYNYKTDVQAAAWQLPQFDADVNVRYTLAKKLNIRLQLYAYGERPKLDTYAGETKATTLPAFMDINLMADYRYKKNISFFLNANNISNSRYQKWYAYPSFGLNLLAGITFSL